MLQGEQHTSRSRADRPPRVVTVIGRMNVGGPAQQVAWITSGLNELGYEATLITGTVGPGEKDMSYVARAVGVEPIVIPELGRELSWKDAIVVWKLYRQFRRLEPDIVHTHTAKAGAVGRAAAWLNRWMRVSTLWGRPRPCRCVHTFHGHIFHSYFGPLKTRLFIAIERFLGSWLTDRIVVLSERQREEIHRTFRVGRKEQFTVLPVAVDVDRIIECCRGESRSDRHLRMELSVPADTFLVGIVGRLVPIKNHGMFIEAAQRLLEEQDDDVAGFHFVIIGDGELRDDLKRQVVERGLASRVTFAGHRMDPATLYADFDAVVLTSHNEGTPMSLLEAMAAGVPIVSSLVGGVPDLLGQRESIADEGYHVCQRGLGVKAGNSAAMAKAVLRLQRDPELRLRLAHAGRQHVSRHHTRSQFLAQTSAMYRDLMGRAAPSPEMPRTVPQKAAVRSTRSAKAVQTADQFHSPGRAPQHMRILITGGAGFIGSHLADACLERGDEVIVIDDLSTGRRANIEQMMDSPRFSLHVADVRDEALLDSLIAECDCVFHLAAAVGVKLVVESPVRTIETNIQGTEAVLRVAARHGRRVLITSTSEVYGLSTSVPFREADNLVMGASTTGRWSYACSKAIDEFLALAYYKERGLPAVVVRLFNTVGPRQTGRYGMVIPTFIRQALTGEPITVHGDGRQTRCFSFVTDVVAALMAVMDHPAAAGEVFNIGSDEEVSIAELAEMVKVKTGSPSEIVTVPYERAYGSGFEDMPRRVPDVSKLERFIGFRPRHTLEEILDGVIVSIREELQQAVPQDDSDVTMSDASDRYLRSFLDQPLRT